MTDTVANYVFSTLPEYCEGGRKALVVDEHTTIEQLNLDSLSLVEAIFAIEEEFAISLDDVDLDALHNVGDLINAVNRARLAGMH